MTLWLWLFFAAFVVIMMVLDLGVFHRHAHAVSIREAGTWTMVWICLALGFNVLLYFVWRTEAFQEHPLSATDAATYFFMGYLIEWMLSMDNVFVFAVIFSYFAVPKEYQHRVLFWGIIGAVVMRLSFVLVGAQLLQHFHWMMYVFGAFLVYTGIKLVVHNEEDVDPERNLVLRMARRGLRVTPGYEGEHFWIYRDGVRYFTPLFLVLIVVETTDVIFAVDSVPAIFGIFATPEEADVFIIFSSNVFAILGLRALYFLLAGIMGMFRYLSTGLAVVLIGIGVKMLATDFLKERVAHAHLMIGSLVFIAAVLAISILASILVARTEKIKANPSAANEPLADPSRPID